MQFRVAGGPPALARTVSMHAKSICCNSQTLTCTSKPSRSSGAGGTVSQSTADHGVYYVKKMAVEIEQWLDGTVSLSAPHHGCCSELVGARMVREVVPRVVVGRGHGVRASGGDAPQLLASCGTRQRPLTHLAELPRGPSTGRRSQEETRRMQRHVTWGAVETFDF